MTGEESPRALRDVCVWCGARPLRDADGQIITWSSRRVDAHCEHETVAS